MVKCNVREAFEKGSIEQLLEKALSKVSNKTTASAIKSIETIMQAKRVYNEANTPEEKEAVLVKWISICETLDELAEPVIRSPRRSLLPESTALRKLRELDKLP